MLLLGALRYFALYAWPSLPWRDLKSIGPAAVFARACRCLASFSSKNRYGKGRVVVQLTGEKPTFIFSLLFHKIVFIFTDY